MFILKREFISQRMVIFRNIILPGQWTKMCYLKQLLRSYLNDISFIFIWFTFPLTFPNDCTSFFPFGNHFCPKHIFFNYLTFPLFSFVLLPLGLFKTFGFLFSLSEPISFQTYFFLFFSGLVEVFIPFQQKPFYPLFVGAFIPCL